MQISQFIELATKLAPMASRIEAAAQVGQEIEADPGVKAALLTAEKYLNDPKVKDAMQTLADLAGVLKQVEGE